MPHSFRVTSQNESDRALGLCHVCFSTIFSQHQYIYTSFLLKVQERTFTKSGGDSSYKCRVSAGTIFQALDWRKFDWIEPLEWRFAQLISVWEHYKFMAIKKVQIAPKCGNLALQHFFYLVCSVLKKHLLYKAQNLSLPTFRMYSNVYLCPCFY